MGTFKTNLAQRVGTRPRWRANGRRPRDGVGPYAQSWNWKNLDGQIDRVHRKTPKGERKTPSTPEPYPRKLVKEILLTRFHHRKRPKSQYFFVCKTRVSTRDILLDFHR